MRELVAATRNEGKLVELRELLRPLGCVVLDLTTAGIPYHPREDAIEDGATFEENALAKARYFAARSGERPVVADDSGLCVRVLGGAPGVRSRRYSGATGDDASVSQANVAHLLRKLAGATDRGAEFVAAVAYVDDATEVVTTGRTTGCILQEPQGADGFGYDPVFWSTDLERSFGNATPAEKAHVSHRARAVEQLVEALRVRRRRDALAVDAG